MLSQKIRKQFLDYFRSKGHTIVPSSSTLPHEDPTLLFTNAGMNQFKDVFLGKSSRSYKKAVSVQKCIRVGGKHNDLDNVGHTSRHMTFFEMIGNFSFGDYFKKEAIAYAWEVSTTIFHFDPSRIWASVFEEDEESFTLWQDYLPKEKIVRLGAKENFWSMGEIGPCGPCSELLYDRGDNFGIAKSPLEENSEERFLEYWNLVFMQFDRQKNGKLLPLPNVAVDTGAGLERILSLMIEVPTVFQTDILRHIIKTVEEVTGIPYEGADTETSAAFHVIADHLRSLSFAIADGAQPGNTEQGYVLRKILRRAVRYGRLLNRQTPFLSSLLPTLLETMGSHYQELKDAKNRIIEILHAEEENFARTLRRGGNILSTIIDRTKASGSKQMSGEDAFKLKDTYGFPIEEILLIAKDSDITIHLDAYQLLEQEAKEKSRRVKKREGPKEALFSFDSFSEHHGTSTFVGYQKYAIESTIIGLIVNGKFVETMSEGEEGVLVLEETPFYPEKGGQVADTGVISHHKAHFEVYGCQSPNSDLIIHLGRVKTGTFMVGEPVQAGIHEKQRIDTTAHHSATHLLHWALQKVLGPHIRQAGSLVDAKRLRFDFTHHKALTKEDLRTIESLVNEKIRANDRVTTYECPLEEVQKEAEIKQFFGDKYGAIVRVVDIAGYSKELCSGTHVDQVGKIGLFRINKEGSIGQGIRRIEALTGKAAEHFCYTFEDKLLTIATTLKSNITNVQGVLENRLKEQEKQMEEIEAMRYRECKIMAKEIGEKAKKIASLSLITEEIIDLQRKELSLLADLLLETLPSAIICLSLVEEDKCHLLLKLSPNLIEKGFNAKKIIQEIAPCIQGSGGGKTTNAQAGGKDPKGIKEAFAKLEIIAQKQG